jgi:hypothetical protein
MCPIGSEPAGKLRRAAEYAITTAIVVGALLLLIGSIGAVLYGLDPPGTLATFWPFYLGGALALLLGWLNGDFWR